MVKSKFKFYGFNNLMKILSFNIYDICYVEMFEDFQVYVQYIDEEYDVECLMQIFIDVVDIIGVNILNIVCQDYDFQGVSVIILIFEQLVILIDSQIEEFLGLLLDIILVYLDKSYIIVYIYLEIYLVDGIVIFCVDIDVFICGVIFLLKVLNYLIYQFDLDIVMVDYWVCGFICDIEGCKYFIDYEINLIQNYFFDDMCEVYQMIDVNVYQENLFYIKMLFKDFELENYLFGDVIWMFLMEQCEQVMEWFKYEMLEIFYVCNMLC